MKGLTAAALLLSSWIASAEEPTNSTSIPLSKKALDQTGVLFWKIHLPDDLEEGEYFGTEWRIHEDVVESGLDLKGVPPGQDVTITLWTASIVQYYRDTVYHRFPETVTRPEGIPFVITYLNEKGSLSSRTGVLIVPKGYEEPYGHLASGDYADAGWLMLRCNRERSKQSDYYAFLEAYWGREEEAGE
ncbi:MAG: hypothetical protein AAGF67_12240 [Verrucomicrobiota bacterium]